MRGRASLAYQLEQYLPEQLQQLIGDISTQAEALGQSLYLVGGVVRDLLLGCHSFDVDLVVEGDAIALAQQVTGTSSAKMILHPRFGTAKLSLGDFVIDLASARNETYARPGALPTVTPGTIKDDIFRRDFSINAMAISLVPSNYGELIDPYRGKEDLEHRLIRILHPRSFTDDATRILRAIRYEQRLGFELEPQTAQLLERDIDMLDTISGDRIRHELELILREKCPEHVLIRLRRLGALKRLSLPLDSDEWIAEKFSKARRLNSSAQMVPLYFCLLACSLSQQENEQFLRRVSMPRRLAQALRDTLHLKARLPLLDRPSMKRSEVYHLLRDYDPLAIQANAIASESSTRYHHLRLFLNELRYVKTHLSGEDLAKLGIPSGPEVGEILGKLLEARLDGETKTKKEEQKLALLVRTRKARSQEAKDQNNKAQYT
jgi:tRNA nucleotidyltransferase (CCA-adding enzyme)